MPRRAGVGLYECGQRAAELAAFQISAALEFDRKLIGDVAGLSFAGVESYHAHRIIELAGVQIL